VTAPLPWLAANPHHPYGACTVIPASPRGNLPAHDWNGRVVVIPLLGFPLEHQGQMAKHLASPPLQSGGEPRLAVYAANGVRTVRVWGPE
jgi:hypothetical protein